MRIVINHVTRMAPGYVCVAGVDLATLEHVRPFFEVGTRLSTEVLLANGGPFNLGGVVSLGRAVSVGEPPEVEDLLVDPAGVRYEGQHSPARLFALIGSLASDELRSVFGEGLERAGRSAAVPLGSGTRSLGCLAPQGDVRLVTERGRNGLTLRLLMTDPDLGRLSLPVTDRRFWTSDYASPREGRIADYNARLGRSEVLLAVGLGRPFSAAPSEPERHWLQVNGVFLANDAPDAFRPGVD